MEDPDECPICFEHMNTFVRIGCCKQHICITCYAKNFRGCPFCRTDMEQLFPVIVLETNWTRIAKIISVSFGVCSCVVIGTLNTLCN